MAKYDDDNVMFAYSIISKSLAATGQGSGLLEKLNSAMADYVGSVAKSWIKGPEYRIEGYARYRQVAEEVKNAISSDIAAHDVSTLLVEEDFLNDLAGTMVKEMVSRRKK